MDVYILPGCCETNAGVCCCLHHAFCRMLPRWRKRTLAVGDSYAYYMMLKSGKLSGVLLFDEAFRMDPVGSR